MSRYRDERPEGGYPSRQGFPPRDYYPPSRPQSYEPRPPQYPGQPAYPPRSADGGPRYAGPVGSRAYEDRGFSNYSSGVGSNYAAPSRHDDRRERSGRDDGPRGVVRDSGWGSGFRPRSPARPRSHHRGRDDDTNRISESSGPTRDNKAGSDLETRVASRSSYRELSPSRGGSGGSLRTDARPSSELTSASGKASYERSSIQASTRASSAARPEFAQTSPVIEPGELVPTPKNAPIDLPSATSRRREGNHSGRAGQSGDGARGESSWTKSQGTHSAHAGRDRRSGYRDEPRHARGSAPDSDSSYANADTLGNKFQYSRRGASPSRTSHASRQAYASAGNPSPPHLRETTTRSTSNRRSRSPDRRLRGDSASPSRRRLSSLHNDSKRTGPTHRERSPLRSPRSRSRSLTISPPPKSRSRRRRGSSCSSVSRSPSPPSKGRRQTIGESDSRPRDLHGRSPSRSPRSPSGSSHRSYSRGQSPSRPYGSTRPPSQPGRLVSTTKADKRPRSPDPKYPDRTFDKKPKVSSDFRATEQTRSFHPRAFPNSSTADTTTLSQRPSLPVGANYRAGPAVPSAPTGPRALRSTLPESSNAFIADHGPRVTVDVSKGPKPKAGFAPIKTTQVAGPPTPAQHPATSNPAKHSGVKRFFPADEEEEAEREDHRKAKETISEEDGERRARTREKQGPEAERAQLARIARDDAGARGQGRFDEDRMAVNGRDHLSDAQSKGDQSRRRPDQSPYRSRRGSSVTSDWGPSRGRSRSRSRSRSRERSSSSSGSRSRSRDRGRGRSRSRSRSVSRSSRGRGRDRDESRSRSRSRTRHNARTVEPKQRNGWMVRDGGEVPPPRARPYHDQDEDRLPFPTRSRQFPLYSRDIPSGPSAGSRRFGNANATPVGPSSQARVPASYERPSFQSFGGPRNGTFHAPTSANAVVPGVVERRWGAPNAASTSVPVPSHPNATEPDTGSGHRPSRPETSPERFSVTAGPGAPPSGTRSDKEVGTPPLATHVSRTPPPAALASQTTEQRRDDDSRSAVLPRDSPVTTAPSAPTSAAPARTAIQALPTANALGAQPTEFYERIVQVGEGTYGKVYKARNVETGELVAMKRIRMEAEKDGFPVTAVREIKLLQNLRHPNVVDLSEMLVSKGHVYMVMEYMDHDLTGILHHPTISFSPAHLKSLMQQFLEGLSFIHRRGVLHRDLKGSNILLSRSGELKIADFGLARFFARGRNNDYTNRVITQWYKPPELLFGATVYGEEVDMWSAGCIFLELFARRPVFQGQDEIHQLEVIFKITGTPSRENWPGVQDLPWYELVKPKTGLPSQLRSAFSKWISPAGLDVAESLLSLDPRGRPTAADALRMDYFVAEDPKPEPPDFLSGLSGSWHEFESKRARRRAREDGKDGTA